MLTEHTLLSIGERAAIVGNDDWAIDLLATAFVSDNTDVFTDMDINSRDTLLTQVRCALFGPAFDCSTQCPECDERLEWQVTAATMNIPMRPLDAGHPAAFSRLRTAQLAGADVRFRHPTTRDLIRARDAADPEIQLLQACVMSASKQGNPIPRQSVGTDVLRKLAAELEKDALGARPGFDLRCPACDARFSRALDILVYLRDELKAWAKKLIGVVHQLAFAYGWSEREILAMRPARRAAYLERVCQ